MQRAKVILNKEEAPGIFLMGLEVGEDYTRRCSPGQFVRLKAWDSFDPLIPRPFTIHAVKDERLYILYQVRGKGTALLSKLIPGEEVQFSPPMGNAFPPLENYVLCAGGVGVAGFGFLLQEAEKGRYPLPKRLYYSARTAELLARVEFFKNFPVPITLITEDGSIGKKGLITDILVEDLKEEKPKAILACGPLGMLKAIARLGEELGIKVYAVLETFLACGEGFCMGCAVPLKNGEYAYLCKTGPTYPAEEIDFERL